MKYAVNYRKKKIITSSVQMKWAGLSVLNNIAEGVSRKTKPERNAFLRFPGLQLWQLIIA